MQSIQDYFWAVFIALFCVTTSYALPLQIVPNATLPTTVPFNGTVAASYIVTNNTNSTRVNNFVKWLPPSVTQNPTGPNACGILFTLGPHGTSTDHCILNLLISGPVNANDPDPSHHLFVCFPGGRVCNGTSFPLNVTYPNFPLLSITVLPANSTLRIGSTQQFSAIGNYADGSKVDLTLLANWSSSTSSRATISKEGLATGIMMGGTAITATFGEISGSTSLMVSSGYAYITNTTNDTVSICPILEENGEFGLCTQTNGGGPTSSFTHPNGIFLANNLAYVANSGNNTLVICPLTPKGDAISMCLLNNDSTLNSPFGIYVSTIKNTTYVTNNTSNSISVCPLLDSGLLAPCTSFFDPSFNRPSGIYLNATNEIAYIANLGTPSISICNIKTDGSLSTPCSVVSIPSVLKPIGLYINPGNSTLYAANLDANTLAICPINANGSISSCTTNPSTFSVPVSLFTNVSNTMAYVTNIAANTVSKCLVNSSNNTLESCAPTGTHFISPSFIFLG